MRKIGSKLFLISLVSIILTATVILIPTLIGITRIVSESARGDMERSVNAIEAVLSRMRRSTLGASLLVAQNADIAAALQTGDGRLLEDTVNVLFGDVVTFSDPDFVTITDSRGVVLFRRHGGETGDSVAHRRGVSLALNRFYNTSDMEPSGESDLGIVSTVPIFADGTPVGTVSVGYDMGKPDFVDYLQRITGMEITVFAYDVSIMTTIVSPQTGERLYGVTIAPHIAEVVLGRREVFYMETEIAPRPGELFLAYYKPFLDATGEVLGLVFSGQNLTAVRAIERRAIRMALGFSALIIVLVFLVSRFANNRIIVLPVKRAIHAVTQLAEGNMQDTDFAVHSRDELGQLLSSTQKMAGAIKAAMKRERDSMERERELELRLSEQKMSERIQLIFDAAPLYIQYWDKDYNAIDCNKITLDFYGFSDKAEYRKAFHASLPGFQPDGVPSVERWKAGLKKIFENGRGQFEFMDRNLDGDFVFVIVDGIRLDYNDSTVVVTYGNDVTGLREANELNQVILDSAPFVVSLWDDNHGILTASKKAAEMFGVSKSRHLAERFLDFSPESQPDGTPSPEKLTKEVGRAYTEGFARFEWMHKTASGEPLPCEAVCKRFTHKGKVMLVSYTMDLREIKAAEKKIAEASRQLEDALEQALSANRAKSAFLSIMSHEIRTPMNAITGMAELLLRGELYGESRGYAHDIKQAGANLLAIINDLLDFSKIEAGKLEIIPAKYLLASLINDVVSIIRMRLVEKPIRFYTNIDGAIPNCLVGDEVRLRQILLNLLSNAVKYTDKGYIGFSITQEKRTDDRIWLRITIIDTGHGIKQEDQEKLFGEFVQVDTKKNRTTEGTGLGLAIVKNLCAAMGGSVELTSKYGEGSSFTVRLPQGVDSQEAFAAVENAGEKKVLVFERRTIYATSVCWSLENMQVPYVMVHDIDDFNRALFGEEWFFVFSGYGLYGKIKPMLDLPAENFPGGKKPDVALMVEWDVEAYIPNVRFVSIPVQSLSIANVLNGRTDRREYFESSDTIQFIYPRARLLVVDDIPTNLKVVEGLLVPYKIVVDTCLSGAEAVELVKRYDYDIVFMDHMMPEMDGIEATAVIRDRERNLAKIGVDRAAVNIVALTANAVSGMKELFIENGFNDFLAKPIDVSKLDKVLERWIPPGKREKAKDYGLENVAASGLPAGALSRDIRDLIIPGLDTVSGVANTGGTLIGYRQVLSVFHKDATERLPLLQTVPTAENLTAFITQVHALKSVCASLGAQEISLEAARLEAAGKAGDMSYVEENLASFAQRLAALTENIGAALGLHSMWGNAAGKTGAAKKAAADVSAYLPGLRKLAEALESQNVSEIDRILEELGQNPPTLKIGEKLDKISGDVLMADFDAAMETVGEMLGTAE